MIQNLKKSIKKKNSQRAKRLKWLMQLTDEVREHALKSYFHYCKEKAAKNFLDWRIQLAAFEISPEHKKALSYRRLSNLDRYEQKEKEIFALYMQHKNDFE